MFKVHVNGVKFNVTEHYRLVVGDVRVLLVQASFQFENIFFISPLEWNVHILKRNSLLGLMQQTNKLEQIISVSG